MIERNAGVPLSHSPAGGTLGNGDAGRDAARTPHGTVGLKALAHLVLSRGSAWDSKWDGVSHSLFPESGTVGQPVPASSIGEVSVWSEAEEERSAIVTYDGNIPREWTEGYARLDPERPLGDVPMKRWRRFIDDVGLFLDRWAERAAELAWGPLDLFGCDRERPFARIDREGLLWLLDGNKVVELDRHKAVIETPTGVRQVFRRKPVAVGAVVLAWELKK